MPHIPRSFASTTGLPPELRVPRQPKGATKQVVPLRAPEGPAAQAKPRLRMIDRISMREHTVPVERVYGQLFNQKVRKDDVTGELLREETSPAQGRMWIG